MNELKKMLKIVLKSIYSLFSFSFNKNILYYTKEQNKKHF